MRSQLWASGTHTDTETHNKRACGRREYIAERCQSLDPCDNDPGCAMHARASADGRHGGGRGGLPSHVQSDGGPLAAASRGRAVQTRCQSRRYAGREEPSYELKGQILAVRPDTHDLLIKHGDIQNFMPAMTMPFKVRDARLLTERRLAT